MMIGNGLPFLREAALKWPILGIALSFFSLNLYEVDPAAACGNLASVDLADTGYKSTILNTSYYENATEVRKLDLCRPVPVVQVSDPLCRVQFLVNTSSVSSITAEAWFPSAWNGRFLALGNGGLGGCIDYDNLEYGSSLGFASVASNNGHDGNSGVAFTNNSEVLADYTSRSVHMLSVVGKELVRQFYGRALGARKAYFMGCSTGGRQGVYAALHHPKDFDGILAGAPATNHNYLFAWSAMLAKYLGAPHGNGSASYITERVWDVVHEAVLRQCDALDGLVDGIISDPDQCDFRPEELICEEGQSQNSKDAIEDEPVSASDCLTRAQVEALRKVYSPLHNEVGEPIFPRFDPGAESSHSARRLIFAGKPFPYADHWMKYVVANDSSYSFASFNLSHVSLLGSVANDPGNISTFSGELSAFRARGGKLLSYHGRADDLIPSGNAKALYDLVARTLCLRPPAIDHFYRLFLIPGMGHCFGGKGAMRFGQNKKSALPHPGAGFNGEDSKKAKEQESLRAPDVESRSRPTNILLALVNWVEHGKPPDTIVGVSEDGLRTRAHCRYPMKSRWTGERWICV